MQLPEIDRPRERFLQYGPELLSTAELLMILLGSGIRSCPVPQLAQELLQYFGSLKNLSDATLAELCQVKGIGKAKAMQIKSAFTLGARASQQPSKSKIPIQTPRQVYELLKQLLVHEMRELFFVILLDVQSRLIAQELVSMGTLTSSLVHPREVFYPAIRHKAARMILVHNHPSGDLTPSQEDIQITQTLIQAGQMMGIPIEDHLILSSRGYLSMRQQGLFIQSCSK